MNRESILEREQVYLESLDEKRRPLEDELFGPEFSAVVRDRGYLLPHELGKIAYWKWYGAAVRVQAGNSTEIVVRFTRAALAHHDDPRLAAWTLTYLHGVDVRMATAILAVLFPEEHTVMDIRSWDGLCRHGWTPDLAQVFGDAEPPDDFLNRCAVYELYLDTCRQKAGEFGVSLRTLDRFLYVTGEPPLEVLGGTDVASE